MEYIITGVWKNSNNVITHYAFHRVDGNRISRAIKTSKVAAIELLEAKDVSATTWVWSYQEAKWRKGEAVEVVRGSHGNYLRTDSDEEKTDNLGHLIAFDWILS